MSKDDSVPYATIKDATTEKFEFCAEAYTHPKDYIDSNDTYH